MNWKIYCGNFIKLIIVIRSKMGKSKSTLVILSRSTGEDTGVEYKGFLFMEEGLLFTSLMLKKA